MLLYPDLYAQTRQGMSQVPERGGESRPPLHLLHLAAWHSMTRSTHRAWLRVDVCRRRCANVY